MSVHGISIHFRSIHSSVMAPGCKCEKRSEMYLHIVRGPWLNIFLLPLKLREITAYFFIFTGNVRVTPFSFLMATN